MQTFKTIPLLHVVNYNSVIRMPGGLEWIFQRFSRFHNTAFFVFKCTVCFNT